MALSLKVRLITIAVLSVLAGLLCLFGGGCSSSLAPTPSPAPFAGDLLELHNRVRAEADVAPLVADPALEAEADEHAHAMAWDNVLSHSGRGAENVGMGYLDAEAVFDGWRKSRGHAANVLNPRYRRFGSAMRLNRYGVPFWCARYQ
jgi:uncharacterized protein YkwD